MKTSDARPENNQNRVRSASWLQFLDAGLELAGITLIFAAGGFGLDRWLGNDRMFATGLVTLLGFSLGMVRFVVRAMASMKVGSVNRNHV